MLLYVTPNTRVHDAGILGVGPSDIEIPARQQSYRVEGACHSQCTETLPWDIHIDNVILHMHYLGKKINSTP